MNLASRWAVSSITESEREGAIDTARRETLEGGSVRSDIVSSSRGGAARRPGMALRDSDRGLFGRAEIWSCSLTLTAEGVVFDFRFSSEYEALIGGSAGCSRVWLAEGCDTPPLFLAQSALNDELLTAWGFSNSNLPFMRKLSWPFSALVPAPSLAALILDAIWLDQLLSGSVWRKEDFLCSTGKRTRNFGREMDVRPSGVRGSLNGDRVGRREGEVGETNVVSYTYCTYRQGRRCNMT